MAVGVEGDMALSFRVLLLAACLEKLPRTSPLFRRTPLNLETRDGWEREVLRPEEQSLAANIMTDYY